MVLGWTGDLHSEDDLTAESDTPNGTCFSGLVMTPVSLCAELKEEPVK